MKMKMKMKISPKMAVGSQMKIKKAEKIGDRS
jgi:hypothetical protein